jgi:glycosyltransferase involved in cell wall biosynthesis
MTDLPKVSALLPAYNAEAFLQRTLDSLAAQTWPNLEIVIADDCSTDRTPRIIAAFARGRPNVRILTREENLGWLRNTNDLMAQATGEMMFFAFHDDVIAPDYVEKLARRLMADQKAILAYSWMRTEFVSGKVRILKFRIMHQLRFWRLLRMWLMVRKHPRWVVPNRGVFRREAFTRIGGIRPNEAGEYGADWAWLLHLSALGRMVMVPEVLCFKYYQKTSLSVGWTHDARMALAQQSAGFREIDLSPASRFEKYVLRRLLTHRVVALKDKARKDPE